MTFVATGCHRCDGKRSWGKIRFLCEGRNLRRTSNPERHGVSGGAPRDGQARMLQPQPSVRRSGGLRYDGWSQSSPRRRRPPQAVSAPAGRSRAPQSEAPRTSARLGCQTGRPSTGVALSTVSPRGFPLSGGAAPRGMPSHAIEDQAQARFRPSDWPSGRDRRVTTGKNVVVVIVSCARTTSVAVPRRDSLHAGIPHPTHG